jgi:hypothetical protein
MIASVSDGGSTVVTTDGGSYTVSDHGLMRYEAAQWSTGDRVRVCRAGAAASISNAANSAKVQADYQGTGSAVGLHCHNATIANVTDNGAGVETADGGAYTISDHGLMRYEAAQWSTGDSVIVCRAGAAASISNAANSAKVQAMVP